MSASIPPTIIILVGQQRMPNAIPIRHFRAGCFRKAEMVYSSLTRSAAADLSGWLRSQGVQVIERPDLMPTEPVNDYSAQFSLITKILDEHATDGGVIVNLTGGTKIMSLAAADAARGRFQTIYVDTESDSLWCVHPKVEKQPITAEFTVADFLQLHGQTGRPPAPPSAQQQEVARTAGAHFEKLEPLLRFLNKQSEGILFARRHESVEQDFLDKCAAAALVSRAPSAQAGSCSWKMRCSRFFTQNDWHECLVFKACVDAGADDVQWKVPIAQTTTDLDVASTRGHLMLICSCKSRGFKNSHLDELAAQGRRIGGEFCKKALIIVEAVPFDKYYKSATTRQKAITAARRELETRAAALGIKVWYWSDYADLPARIRELLSSGRR